jgi:uncharacterized protein YceH (UPF0502 family)
LPILRGVHLAPLTAPEQRVLGCLIEKRWTTPDAYPLSLNALRLACNQSTNRDPVTAYDEATVRDAAQRLSKYGLARLASGQGSRATKYRHLAEDALGLGRPELAVLSVLLLRGPQTPGELKGRTERMAQIGSLAEVEEILDRLTQRGYATRLGRRPGQKEDRFAHTLGGTGEDVWTEPSAAPGAVGATPTHVAAPATSSLGEPPESPASQPAAADGQSLAARVAALEAELVALRAEVEALRG